MARVLVVLAFAVLAVDGRRVAKRARKGTAESLVQDVLSAGQDVTAEGWNPYYSFQAFFKAEGYTPEQIEKIQTRFYQDQMDNKKWPMRDHAQELADSASNFANKNKQQIKDAITKAGGNQADIASSGASITSAAENILCNKDPTSSTSLLQSTATPVFPKLPWVANKVQANMCSLEYLSGSMSMLTGSVATNTAAIASLAACVSSNTGAIAALQGQVALMGEVAAPTFALASSLGVSSGTVASLALAGSFVGPILGVIALIYVAWPEEDIDPWMQVEARVSQMICDKFDAARRKRLSDRLRRYLVQFSQCSKAWIAQNMVKHHGVAVPKWIVEEAATAKASGNFDRFLLDHTGSKKASVESPACMSQLEGHMSLERDEWYKTESCPGAKGGMGGLFMPFANVHTQILSMLADHPYDDKMQWRATLKCTSAEYGAYMLKHIIAAWQAQVCRTMRLRHSKSGLASGWKYQWVVLKPVEQPNAGESCTSKCGGKSGWCDYCGGPKVGACCKNGDNSDDPVCKQFDVPLAGGLITDGAHHVCVHASCIQADSSYSGTEVKQIAMDGEPIMPENCQQMCQDLPETAFFSTSAGGATCTCFKAEGTTRYITKGASSGPTVCGKADDSLETREKQYEEALEEKIPNVPVDQLEPCKDSKSPGVSNFAELEQKHPDWVKSCFAKATKLVTLEFNTFYKRLGKFVDTLAWQAGCGAQRAVQWDQGGWNSVSTANDGGSFGSCNWRKEEELDRNMNQLPWMQDREKSRGWMGYSKIDMDEQKTVTTQYPMPTWLHDLKRQLSCLQHTCGQRSLLMETELPLVSEAEIERKRDAAEAAIARANAAAEVAAAATASAEAKAAAEAEAEAAAKAQEEADQADAIEVTTDDEMSMVVNTIMEPAIMTTEDMTSTSDEGQNYREMWEDTGSR